MEYYLFHRDDFSTPLPEAISYLNEEERLRYASTGLSFLIPRVLLKQELARKLHLHPTDLHLSYHPEGKPYLASHPELHFNLTHTADLIAIAMDHRPIGIDVEVMKPRNFQRIAKKIMTESGYSSFIKRGATIREFYTYWCCCEALIKQVGSSIWQAQQYRFCIEDDYTILCEDRRVTIDLFTPHAGVMGAIASYRCLDT